MALMTGLAIRVREPPSDAPRHLEKQGTGAPDEDAKPKTKKKKTKTKKNKSTAAAREDPARFAREYGTNFSAPGPWIRICRDLGFEGPLSSKTQCKKVLAKTYVNIRDFLDAVDQRNAAAQKHSDPSARAAAREAPVEVRRFKNERALSAYTLQSGRVYPRKKIKQDEDHPLKLLMRHIL